MSLDQDPVLAVSSGRSGRRRKRQRRGASRLLYRRCAGRERGTRIGRAVLSVLPFQFPMGRWRRSSQYRSLTAGFALTAGLTVVGAGLGLSGSFNATASPAAASTPSSPAVGAAQSSPATKATPVNLLTGNQSTFTTSTGGWSGSQGVVTWNDTSGDPTPGSLELTSSGAKGASAWSASSGATATPAQPGEVSEGTAFVEAVGGSRGASAVLEFYGKSGGILDVAWGQAKTASPGGWVSLPPVVGLAPAGTVSVGLGIVDWAPTQGAQLLIDTASLEALRDSVSPLTGPLSTSGTEVLDARGHHVVLRGIDYSGLELTAYPAGLTEHTFAQMRAWGADTVRVDLYGPMLLANSCAYWPQYVNEVNQAVNWITSLGMLAVLELHMVNPADLTAPKSACPPATNEIMADAPGPSRSGASWRHDTQPILWWHSTSTTNPTTSPTRCG